ncbi:MAG: hypothetical protein O2904_01975 [bacterium]|nr:hypothetical protein [bacterium]
MNAFTASQKLKEPSVSFQFPQPEEPPLELGTVIINRKNIEIISHDHNIDQSLITVTEDKALICLSTNMMKIGKRKWIHPLSLICTMLLALATSDFNKLHWINSELLKAFFIVSSCTTAGWLIWEIMHDAQLKEVPEVIDDIFRELRS